MGFEFSRNKSIEVEICGTPYSIDVADDDKLAKVGEFGKKLAGSDYGSMKEGAIKAASHDCRAFLDLFLGKGAVDEIYKARGGFNLLDGVELLAYLIAELQKAKVGESFDSAVSRYLPDLGADEA